MWATREKLQRRRRCGRVASHLSRARNARRRWGTRLLIIYRHPTRRDDVGRLFACWTASEYKRRRRGRRWRSDLSFPGCARCLPRQTRRSPATGWRGLRRAASRSGWRPRCALADVPLRTIARTASDCRRRGRGDAADSGELGRGGVPAGGGFDGGRVPGVSAA